MPLKRLLAHSLVEFDALLKEALATAGAAAGGKVFVLFTGASGADGASWCPDCNECKPAVGAALAAAGEEGEVALVEVPLVRAEYRGNPEHWARKHAAVKLKAIPTLLRWGKVAKVAELVEGECADEARVKELVLE
jgi:hypothetical protein